MHKHRPSFLTHAFVRAFLERRLSAKYLPLVLLASFLYPPFLLSSFPSFLLPFFPPFLLSSFPSFLLSSFSFPLFLLGLILSTNNKTNLGGRLAGWLAGPDELYSQSGPIGTSVAKVLWRTYYKHEDSDAVNVPQN